MSGPDVSDIPDICARASIRTKANVRRRLTPVVDSSCPLAPVFGRVALLRYLAQNRGLAEEVVESDGLGPAIAEFVESRGTWGRKSGPRPAEVGVAPFPPSQTFGAGTRLDRNQSRFRTNRRLPTRPPNPPSKQASASTE